MKQPIWWRVTLQVNGSEYLASFNIRAESITQISENTLIIDGCDFVYPEKIVSVVKLTDIQQEITKNES